MTHEVHNGRKRGVLFLPKSGEGWGILDWLGYFEFYYEVEF
jgi:hypothetical protein